METLKFEIEIVSSIEGTITSAYLNIDLDQLDPNGFVLGDRSDAWDNNAKEFLMDGVIGHFENDVLIAIQQIAGSNCYDYILPLTA